jgi:hypothetical protein
MVLGMVIVDDAVEVENKSLQKNNISSGGATWETYLTGNRGKPDSEAILYRGDISGDPDIPLEVVVDYCIIQEILSQYPFSEKLDVCFLLCIQAYPSFGENSFVCNVIQVAVGASFLHVKLFFSW